MLNLIAFSVVAYWLRDHLVPLFSIEPFLTMGRASLRVFCAHILFVFVGLAFLMRDVGHDNDTIEQLSGWSAALLVIITLVVLFLLAASKVRKDAPQATVIEACRSLVLHKSARPTASPKSSLQRTLLNRRVPAIARLLAPF
jgi:hypothetical protein